MCKMVSGRQDVWYAINIEIGDYLSAMRGLKFSANCSTVYNPAARDVWIKVDRSVLLCSSRIGTPSD